jgi:hypothetical protein
MICASCRAVICAQHLGAMRLAEALPRVSHRQLPLSLALLGLTPLFGFALIVLDRTQLELL